MGDHQSPLAVFLDEKNLDVRDVELFFKLLKIESHEADGVDLKAFTNGFLKIKGSATSLDMQVMLVQQQLMYQHQVRRFKHLEHTVAGLKENIRKPTRMVYSASDSY